MRVEMLSRMTAMATKSEWLPEEEEDEGKEGKEREGEEGEGEAGKKPQARKVKGKAKPEGGEQHIGKPKSQVAALRYSARHNES